MTFRKSIFQPIEPKKNYSITLTTTEEKNPVFILSLHEKTVLFVDKHKQNNVAGLHFEDKDGVKITITPDQQNVASLETAFRNIISNAHENRIIYLKDQVEILERLDGFLEDNGLKERKTNSDVRRYSDIGYGRGNTAY